MRFAETLMTPKAATVWPSFDFWLIVRSTRPGSSRSLLQDPAQRGQTSSTRNPASTARTRTPSALRYLHDARGGSILGKGGPHHRLGGARASPSPDFRHDREHETHRHYHPRGGAVGSRSRTVFPPTHLNAHAAVFATAGSSSDSAATSSPIARRLNAFSVTPVPEESDHLGGGWNPQLLNPLARIDWEARRPPCGQAAKSPNSQRPTGAEPLHHR